MPSATPGTNTTSTVPLDGCCIAFSGTFPGRNQASLLKYAGELGAATSKSVTTAVTHLVTTQADCNKVSTKVQHAKDYGIFIVALDWMLDSENGVKQDESKYTLIDTSSSPSSSPSPNPSTAPALDPASSVSAPKKRQASNSPAPEPKKSKLEASNGKAPAIGESQIAKDWAVQIPIDEGCTLAGYGVHVGADSVIWDATLNQTSASKNANKFYRLQVLVGANNDCKLWTRWGRISEPGKSAVLGDGSLMDAMRQFQKKFKEKSGLAWEDRTENPKPGKYVFIERNYEQDSEAEAEGADDNADDGQPGSSKAALEERKPPPCTLEPAVQQLMELIFNQQYFAATMSAMNYDDKKMPLGKLSQATILRGFQMLKDLTAVIQGTSPPSTSVETLSDLYYSLIPHVFGNRSVRPPIVNNLDMVKKEIELLETLADMKDATNIMKTEIDEMNRVHPLDRQFKGLGMEEMTVLDPNSTEFQLLETYLTTTCGQTHNANYEIETIFRIERRGEQDRFQESLFRGPPRDRRLLWHGSRATNFGGILSQGLRIAPPEAPATGYMFGKGVYLADMSSKSANYCYSYISGGTALLLLCEAELGDPMRELTHSDTAAAENAKANGCWSTFGKGQTAPSLWKDASCVHPSLQGVKMPSTKDTPPGDTGLYSSLLYNEYICYDVAQIRLRYLFRVKM